MIALFAVMSIAIEKRGAVRQMAVRSGLSRVI
jgi:hypothetical protein